MSANLRNYLVSIFGFEHVIRSVPASAWDNPSPCDKWTARDVTGHSMAVISNVASRAGVGDSADPFADPPGTFAGDDPLVTWYAVRDRLLTALDHRGALQTELKSSLGTMTVDAFVGLMIADCTIHTWDLARAAGVDERLDPMLVDYVQRDLEQRKPEMLRAPHRYGEAVDATAEHDAQTRMLLFTGRRP